MHFILYESAIGLHVFKITQFDRLVQSLKAQINVNDQFETIKKQT